MKAEYPQALECLLAARPSAERTTIAAAAALGRVLAADVVFLAASPPRPVSAMDGVALRARPVAASLLRVGSSTPAVPWSTPVAESACVEILTGAALAPGTDAVVAIEDLDVIDGAVQVPPVSAGANVVPAGAAYPAGARIPAGTRLGPAAVESIASAGLGPVSVWSPPAVRIIPLGDELISGAVRDTLAPTLAAWLRRMGVAATAVPPVGDDVRALEHSLAAKESIVITTGGTGPSRVDMVRQMSLEPLFDSVRIKPGQPTKAFRLPGDRLWIALPGNPTAALLIFAALVRPVFRGYANLPSPLHLPLAARLEAHPERWRIAPVSIGETDATPVPSGPSVSTGWWMHADGITMVRPGDSLEPGNPVEVWPW